MNEGDELLAMIRQHVASSVEPEYREYVTDVVARTVATIMSDSKFFNRLSVVMNLQAENFLLKQALAQTNALLNRVTPIRKPAPKKPRRPVAKKVVKKSPTIQVKGSTATNRRAFKNGYKGA